VAPNETVTNHGGFGLKILNFALHVTHLFVIGFSVIGWMFPATRLANLVLLLMILVSWYGFGPFFGKRSAYGYCVITDLQWRLRRRMGLEVPPWGYMKYLIDAVAGRQVDAGLIDRITVFAFFISLAASTITTLEIIEP
jgi:hypothetical protein